MSEFFVCKVLYEKNSTKGLDVFDNETDLAEHVLEARDLGAVSIRVFRCVEVDFHAYRTGANIQIRERS